MTLTLYPHIFFTYSISCMHVPSFRSQAAKVSEKSIVFTFTYRRAYVTQFDIVVKQVKVNPGLSFEQTISNPSPQCYIPSFVEISPLVLEKIFLNIFTIYGRGGHLGNLTSNILITFSFPCTLKLTCKIWVK